MIELKIDKLYRYNRESEPCFIGFPLPKGDLFEADHVCILDGQEALPLQTKVTSRYEDGSVRFLFLRFLADLPANAPHTLQCDLHHKNQKPSKSFHSLKLTETESGIQLATVTDDEKPFIVSLKNHSDALFESVIAEGKTYGKECFEGPLLTETGIEEAYSLKTGTWEITEQGPVCVIVKTSGTHYNHISGKTITFEVRLTFWAGKPWFETAYRIINTDSFCLTVSSLSCRIHRKTEHTVRSTVASSNYKTDYAVSETGEPVSKTIDAEWIMNEANEQYSEVFYGTFFADWTDEESGIAATVYQAHQNFPKALEADRNGITIHLVPANTAAVTLQSGMAREQKFLLHFHDAQQSLESINDRSIVYQMPYRPYVSPDVHKASGVWPEIFTDQINVQAEQNLVARADNHARSYGMLNFGDCYDQNYTEQGRGGGRLVWSNNEYDYPHACALLFARNGIRRFLDYLIVSASHWMDVDICHYHEDPLFIGGQWEHTAGHVINGRMLCSHQWVEGLLDYYHFTGDERGFETAIGIGDNVLRLLETPAYAVVGEANARETGWALRSLVALYVETHDEKWIKPCERIVNDFKVWEDTFGHWMAPYTDNTMIRVPFMIAVAIGSLMRYYRVFPSDELKDMIIRQVDDLIENCYVKEWGLFYYKELPSLTRLGNNTLLLEALTIAYDLTKDTRYLECGIGTFRAAIHDTPSGARNKRIIEDAVIMGTVTTKRFGQSMIPLSGFYRALGESGMKFE